MGLRLFVLDLWGLLLSQSHSCSVYSVMNSLIFILFCLFRFDPVWLLRKKKRWGCGEIERNEGFYVEDEGFVVYVHTKASLFSIIYIFLLITLFLLK